MAASILLAGAFARLASSFAVPLTSQFSVHEQADHIPAGWQFHSEATGQENIALRLVLNDGSEDIWRIADLVSDPEHSRYGQYLSADELKSATRGFNTCEPVLSWLRSHEVDNAVCDDGYAYFTTTVSRADRMLDTRFQYFQRHNDAPTLRTTAYSLPAHIAEHVDFIFPTVHFLSGSQKSAHSLVPRQHYFNFDPTCADSICPQNLTEKYNITYFPPDGESGSKIGIVGFTGHVPNKTDVVSFLAANGQTAQQLAPSFAFRSINNGSVSLPATVDLQVEPTLDLDYTLAFTGPLPATFYSTGGNISALSQPGNQYVPPNQSDNEPFLEFFKGLLAEEHPAQVISISYSDDEQSVPFKYARKVCNQIAQATARGITVVGSSGDGGAQGTGYSNCIGPNGDHRYIPTFPSSCPYITSVGATASYGGPADYSSGGFSNYFPVPQWQAAATTHFIELLNGTGAGLYNASGRGIPDVSLIGDDYLIEVRGGLTTASGTSASTPVFAAMIALINDLRLRAGKPVLGCLNPRLYSSRFASAFDDVISEYGSSNGCSDGNFTAPGWPALPGWDASTGIGTPRFETLAKLLT